MGRNCDVCGAQVVEDQRFCPACGLEMVEPSSESAGTRTTTPEPWDWPADPSSRDVTGAESTFQDYVLRQAAPEVGIAREKLHTAQQLLAQGRLRQCGELLRTVRDQLGDDPEGRQLFRRIARQVKLAKSDVIRRAEDLVEDPLRLHGFLTGPAAEQLNREEICRLALAAVRQHYARDAESVHALVRLPAFRQIGDKQLRAEHERLEQLVWRKKRRQHFYLSAAIFAVVIVLAVPGLFIWVWFLMQFSLRVKLVLSAAALCALIWGLEPLRKWITLMVEGEEDEDD